MSAALTKTEATGPASAFPLPLGRSIIEAEQRSQKAFGQALQSIAAVQRSSTAAREADDARIIELEKALKLSEERRIAAEAACKAKLDAAEAQNQSLKEDVALHQNKVKALEGTLEAGKQLTQLLVGNAFGGSPSGSNLSDRQIRQAIAINSRYAKYPPHHGGFQRWLACQTLQKLRTIGLY